MTLGFLGENVKEQNFERELPAGYRQAKYIKSKQSFDICYTLEDNAYKHGEVQLQIESINTKVTR